MFQQLLQGQAASAQDVAKQFSEVNHYFHDLNTKIEALHSKVKYLESNHTSTSTVKTTGQLPGKAIQNPKEFCNIIQSTNDLDAEDEQVIEDFCNLLDDDGVDHLMVDNTVGVQRSIEEMAAVTPLLVSEDSDRQDGEGFNECLAKTEKPTLDVCIDHLDRSDDSSSALSAAEPEISMEKRSSFIPPPYKPKLPFPGRFKKKLIAEHQAKIDEQIKILESKMPLIEAVKLIPKSHEYLKDLIMKRIEATQGEKLDSEECSAVISKEEATPEKLGDPGSFTLPCSLGPKTFNSCLCDLGSSVSLMPHSVAKRLGFRKYSPTNISLVLADRSVKKPHGLLQDLPVRVGSVDIPTDFIVLDMDEEPKDPLLLGRPFLATAGAVIDVKNGKIELNLGKGLKMTFDIRDAAKRPTIEGQTFCIEETGLLADASLEQLTDEGHLPTDVVKSGNVEHPRSKTLGFEKLVGTHKAVNGSEIIENMLGSKIEVVAAKEKNLTPALHAKLNLQVESIDHVPDDWSDLQALNHRSKWQDATVKELTTTVRELTGLVKEMKAQINELHGQTSGSPSRKVIQGVLTIKEALPPETIIPVNKDGTEFTVDVHRVKPCMTDPILPEGTSVPLHAPPWA